MKTKLFSLLSIALFGEVPVPRYRPSYKKVDIRKSGRVLTKLPSLFTLYL